MDFIEALVEKADRDRSLSGWRIGPVEAIEIRSDRNLYTIDGRPMPMIQDTGTVAEGTMVAWINADDPFAIGPFRAGA